MERSFRGGLTVFLKAYEFGYYSGIRSTMKAKVNYHVMKISLNQ